MNGLFIDNNPTTTNHKFLTTTLLLITKLTIQHLVFNFLFIRNLNLDPGYIKYPKTAELSNL